MFIDEKFRQSVITGCYQGLVPLNKDNTNQVQNYPLEEFSFTNLDVEALREAWIIEKKEEG